MPVTKDQAQQLASLACAARPVGARRWDAAGVVAAIGKVKHLHLPDVAMAVIRAADDRSLETPGAIGNPAAPCWRERNLDRPAVAAPSHGPWCRTCGAKREDHRAVDHEFEPPAEKRDPETVARIVGELRGLVVEAKAAPEPAAEKPSPPPNVHATAARAAMTPTPPTDPTTHAAAAALSEE